MNANELRMGNWVLLNGKPTEVYGTLLDYCDKQTEVPELSPIPLTLEILEKAGFKKSDFYHILKGRGDQTTFSIGWDGHILNVFDDGFEMSHGVLLLAEQSKYVHQLQNLYFALCGTELNINL